MKRGYWILIIVIIAMGVFIFKNYIENDKISVGEEEVIKSEKETSEIVKDSSDAISCAINLYKKAKADGMKFVSQCLGSCGDYAVDIVHIPKNDIDNLAENQCKDYREGKVSKFVELDQEGNLFRIF